MTVGRQLAQARTERKLSLAEVTRHTKIQPWVLEALEGDRLLDQMSPIYVRGFLSTYARFLQLDPTPLVALLSPPEPPAEASAQAAPAPSREHIPSAIQFRMPQIPKLPPMPKLPDLPRFPSIPWDAVWRFARPAAAVAAIVGIIAVNPLRWVPKPAWSLPKLSMPHLKAPKTKAASVTPIKDAKPMPLPTLTLLPTQALELTISAERTTWVQVRADGKLLTQQRLQRGANERWVAKKRLELVVAKPSQVDVSLNGQPISPFAIAHQGRLLITHYGVTRLPDDAS